MCSALKCLCRCLQGRPGVCRRIQADRTVRVPVSPSVRPSVNYPASPARHTSLQTTSCSRQSVCHGYAPQSGLRARSTEEFGSGMSACLSRRRVCTLTQILSTADAPPKGLRTGAHAHGTRSGASREVYARDFSRGRRRERTTRSAGNDAKGVRAKFRYGVARSEQWVVLNFDLTPFASKQDLTTTNHAEPNHIEPHACISEMPCRRKLAAHAATAANTLSGQSPGGWRLGRHLGTGWACWVCP